MKLSRALGTALVIVAGATLGMSVAHSQVQSDLLVVTPPGGPPITMSIFEGAGGEPGAVFSPIPGLDPGGMDIPFLLSVGAHFVMLTEAPGAVPGPGEIGIPVPCPVQPGQCLLSDIVVGMMDATGPHVALYSDPHPVFVSPDLPGLFPFALFLDETGAIQDLTAELGFAGTGFTVGVLSDGDVVPLPAAVWLFGSALGVMGVMRRKVTA